MSEDKPHDCITGPACRDSKIVNDERQPAKTEKPDTLCPACLKHLTSCCEQLPHDWKNLRAALGERRGDTADKVRSTPTPAMPISTAREALMADIVDLAERAAAIVSDALHTDQPQNAPGRRHKLPPIPTKDGPKHPEEGSTASIADEHTRPDAQRRLGASIAIVAPHIDLLAAADPQPALIWRTPRRCAMHSQAITTAQEFLEVCPPNRMDDARNALRRAHAAAARCDTCNAWDHQGQAREITEQSGLELALTFNELHNRVRADLGKTRLRHRYAMPCPRCGARVGRDDGSAIVNCDNDTCTTKGASSWTEREYKWLVGLIVDERREMELSKWLVLEAYWRLDSLRIGAEKIRTDPLLGPLLEQPNSGKFVLEGIDIILAGHLTPEARAAASSKADAEQRQTDDDKWEWRNDTVYKKPKAKERRPRELPEGVEAVATSSLLTVTDVEYTTPGRWPTCSECHLEHPPGDCP